MPLYDYECQDCGFKFDQFHYLYTPTTWCPKCTGIAKTIPSVVNHTFGFRLDKQSHLPGHKDELERAI